MLEVTPVRKVDGTEGHPSLGIGALVRGSLLMTQAKNGVDLDDAECGAKRQTLP